MPKPTRATVHFNHRTAIPAGESQDIAVVEDIEGESEPVQFTRDMCTEPYKRVTPVRDVEALLEGISSKNAIPVCIGYQNALGQWYETRQNIYLSSQKDLAIEVDAKRNHPNRPMTVKACGGKL